MQRMIKIVAVVAMLGLVAAAAVTTRSRPRPPAMPAARPAATGAEGAVGVRRAPTPTRRSSRGARAGRGGPGHRPRLDRAGGQDLDQATIDKAMECWSQPECDTGSGGELAMGYADGGGHLNVWRAVTRMEAILQALTYPRSARPSRRALWDQDPAVPAGDINFLVQRGADFIIGYPDAGVAIADAIAAAEEAGVLYIPFSAGWVGLPEQEGALIPGEDYTSVVGEDLCALGESFAQVLNDNIDSGSIGVLGGTPGNALSLGWQQCLTPALNDRSRWSRTRWTPSG